jgi:hypothetical protein
MLDALLGFLLAIVEAILWFAGDPYGLVFLAGLGLVLLGFFAIVVSRIGRRK